MTNQYLPNQSMPQMIKESVEQVRLANQAGFDLICTGQHYMASPYQMSSSLPLLARLAAESGSMEIAATVILIPLHNMLYIDSNNNVYDPQDILDNKINPTVIAKWKKNNNDSR